ncbi:MULTISPECIES: hypothetical protein [unclassified Mesorhizobium]|uniref:hypothetical protein n=1 Tax=unclassified Mesorhizobium TaxID=325217 RepID=UPI0015E3A6F3|nr:MULTISPECIES: hypothetical protein [unclassified Mesorhizobium]
MAAAKEHLIAAELFPAWHNRGHDDGIDLSLHFGGPIPILGIACAVVPLEQG